MPMLPQSDRLKAWRCEDFAHRKVVLLRIYPVRRGRVLARLGTHHRLNWSIPSTSGWLAGVVLVLPRSGANEPWLTTEESAAAERGQSSAKARAAQGSELSVHPRTFRARPVHVRLGSGTSTTRPGPG